MALGLEVRATQLWGSLHAPTTEAAVHMIGDTVGEHLALGFPHGEVDRPEVVEQKDWIVGNVKNARNIRGIEVVKEGDFSDYNSIPEHRLSRRLRSDDITLDYHKAAQLAAPVIWQETARIGRSDLGVWVGVAEGKQTPSFLFGNIKMPGKLPDIPRGGIFPKYYEAYVEATDREIKSIYKDLQLGKDTVVSIESPGATIATLQMARVSKRLGKIAAHTFAKDIVSHVAQAPEDAILAVHLCRGRYGGEPYLTPNPQDKAELEALVNLANEIDDQWPKRHRRAALIGLPLGAEGHRTPIDRKLFEPLVDLVLPYETRFGAGIITPQTPVEDLVELVPTLDDLTNKLVVPMAPCGLASLRHNPEEGVTLRTLQLHADVVRATR